MSELKTVTDRGDALIHVDLTSDGLVIMEPTYLGFLRSQGYPILSVEQQSTVSSSSEDHSYLVLKVLTRAKPAGHPELDFVEDEFELWVCSCEDFRYNQSVDVSKGASPTETGRCKHIHAVDKTARARDDDSQETLL